MIKDFIVIIGSMKSGTTTLFAQLDAHPAITGAKWKESSYFAFEEVYSMGWDWYDGMFQFEPGTTRYALEGSTDYTKEPFVTGVTDRMRSAEAEGRRFRLIYIMRHPVDRLISHARHVAVKGREVGRFWSPRPDHSLDAGLSPVNLATSDYAAQLEPYQDWFDRGDLFLMTFEELISDGAEVMGRIGAWLDLPDLTFTEERERENAIEARTKPNPLWDQMSSIGGLKKVAKTLVPDSARQKLKDSMRKPVEIEGRFKLTDEERADLIARFAPQARILHERYGFDPKWAFD